jgi:hypothetical protein
LVATWAIPTFGVKIIEVKNTTKNSSANGNTIFTPH